MHLPQPVGEFALYGTALFIIYTHNPHTNPLINAVIGLSQLNIGRLRKRGFDLTELASLDWSHPAVLLFTFALYVYIVSTSCTHYCLFIFHF